MLVCYISLDAHTTVNTRNFPDRSLIHLSLHVPSPLDVRPSGSKTTVFPQGEPPRPTPHAMSVNVDASAKMPPSEETRKREAHD